MCYIKHISVNYTLAFPPINVKNGDEDDELESIHGPSANECDIIENGNGIFQDLTYNCQNLTDSCQNLTNNCQNLPQIGNDKTVGNDIHHTDISECMSVNDSECDVSSCHTDDISNADDIISLLKPMEDEHIDGNIIASGYRKGMDSPREIEAIRCRNDF